MSGVRLVITGLTEVRAREIGDTLAPLVGPLASEGRVTLELASEEPGPAVIEVDDYRADGEAYWDRVSEASERARDGQVTLLAEHGTAFAQIGPPQ